MLWSNIKRQEMRHFFILILAIIVLQPLNAQSLYFPPVTGSTWDTISPKTLGYCQTNIDRLYEFLESDQCGLLHADPRRLPKDDRQGVPPYV